MIISTSLRRENIIFIRCCLGRLDKPINLSSQVWKKNVVHWIIWCIANFVGAKSGVQ